MDDRRRSPVRMLAPVALIAATLAVVVVVASSGSDGSGSAQPAASTATSPASKQGSSSRGASGRIPRRTYTVKTGDSLQAIADKNGVTLQQLQELNPDVDPQALTTGQKLKLRE